MLIDAHIHLFTPAIVANVVRRSAVVTELHLQAEAALQRLSPAVLTEALHQCGLAMALHLPTARADGVAQVNRQALAVSKANPMIATAGTLHPHCTDIPVQLARLRTDGVRAIKLCSFSQGFQPDGPEALAMFAQIQNCNLRKETPFCVILDTYYHAADHFGCRAGHITTPQCLGRLVRGFPGIPFVGAHMGGLGAPEDLLIRDLRAAPNLFLDTSNAAHTLSTETFVRLLQTHGPRRILFGTDWPWFHPRGEIALINDLLTQAGFSADERTLVFGENAVRLLGLRGCSGERFKHPAQTVAKPDGENDASAAPTRKKNRTG